MAAGMALLGIIRPETPYNPNAATPSCQLWFSGGFLFVTVQRDLGSTATWTGVRDGGFPGFVYGRIHALGGQDTLILGVAAWALAVMFGLYPAQVLVRSRALRWRRRRQGLCVKYGYDLTGNTSGRCSECGKTIQDTH